ncbi:MAG: HEAT repeat domain-containing protein [Fimbriimonas sp.]
MDKREVVSLSCEARLLSLVHAVEEFRTSRARNSRGAVREVARVLIHDENESNRIDAVDALQLAGIQADLLALVSCTYDHAWAVRASAYGALVAVGRKRALSHLRRGTFDPNPIVRRYAYVGIFDVLGEESRAELQRHRRSERDPLALIGIDMGLAHLGEESSIAALKENARSTNPHFSSPAKTTLEELYGIDF